DFVITAHELRADGRVQRARFRSRGRFEREALPPVDAPEGALLASSPWVCYVTDVADTPRNREALASFLHGADLLFIETVFLDADRQHAARKAHLTARAAGEIARAAGVRTAVPFHFSPRYLGREDELRREFEESLH
ncbi:MAG: ribonuclease Z, partial [Gammaproteobacteria bacterium]|nr:ribonuclease Z [Gammaproteobacteria bacterium]